MEVKEHWLAQSPDIESAEHSWCELETGHETEYNITKSKSCLYSYPVLTPTFLWRCFKTYHRIKS